MLGCYLGLWGNKMQLCWVASVLWFQNVGIDPTASHLCNSVYRASACARYGRWEGSNKRDLFLWSLYSRGVTGNKAQNKIISDIDKGRIKGQRVSVLPLGSRVWGGPLWEGDSSTGHWGWEGAGHMRIWSSDVLYNLLHAEDVIYHAIQYVWPWVSWLLWLVQPRTWVLSCI